MNARQYRTLSNRIVDRLAVDDKDAVFWDRELPGFGLRVYPSGTERISPRTHLAVYNQPFSLIFLYPDLHAQSVYHRVPTRHRAALHFRERPAT